MVRRVVAMTGKRIQRRRRRTRRFPAFLVIAVAIIAAVVMAAFASSHADTDTATATVTIKPTPPMEVAPLIAAQVDKPEAEAVTPPASTPSPSPAPTPDEKEVEMLARMIWGEARGIASDMEKAACVWCVLNRVDNQDYPDTVAAVLEQPYQFAGYSPDYPATEEHKAIAADVLTRWMEERAGAADVGRILPAEYLFFTGDGKHNIFTDEWRGGATWDWSLENPYEN